MDIRVKPMRFGDSNLIISPTWQLLVDCGSDNRADWNGSSEFAFSAIRDDIADQQITDLLITHFHKDHFNGILLIPDNYRFRTIYLPYSIINGSIPYSGALSRLLAIASPQSWGFRLAGKIIELFGKIELIANDVRFVRAGDEIHFDTATLRVLWPEITYHYENLPVKIIPSIVVDRGQKQNMMAVSQEDSSEEFSRLTVVEEALEEQFVKIVGEDNQELLEARNDFQAEFTKYLEALHDRERNRERTNNAYLPVKEAYQNLNVVRRRFHRWRNGNEVEIIRLFARQQYHSLVTSMNAISIVIDCLKKFIFLGDAPATIIDHISSSFVNPYHCVKLQHHATDAYYTENTPQGTIQIVSNGGYSRRKASERFVNEGNSIICTNAHENPEQFCNYYIMNGRCNPICQQIDNQYDIIIP